MAFRDGLGERRLIADADGTSVEVLCLRRELSAVPSFEFALRERAARLAQFQHGYFSHVRSVDRSATFHHALTVASDAVPGLRLSELLASAHERGLAVPIGAALCLIRQLVPAVAILHETARDAAHGALAPQRLVLGPNHRLVIVEYVLGSALEQLLYSRERYWTELRVALPRVAGLPRFDHLAAVTQIGAIALQLIAGRLLRDDEYPGRVGEIVSTATAVSGDGAEPLAPPIRNWVTRALQLDPRHSFPSAIEARSELERAIGESGYDASPDELDGFLARYHAPDSLPVALVAPAPPIADADESSVVVPVDWTPAVVHTSAVHELVLPQPIAAAVSALPSTSADAAPPVTAVTVVPMDAEQPVVADVHAARRRSRGRLITAAAAVIVLGVVLAGGAMVGARRFLADGPEPTASGTLTIATNPTGAAAIVDGVHRGMTPVTLSIAAGPHRLELRGEGEPRVISLTMTAGAQLSHYVDLPRAAVPLPVAEASSEAAGPAPPAPVSAAADETLVLAGWLVVQVKAGAATGASHDNRFDVDVYEGDRLLGSSRVDRIMLPVGRHDLELVNTSVGLRSKRSVQVAAGKVSTVSIDRPNGTLAINAVPWAEVWVDGEKVGETPIGSFETLVGAHNVVFRHPELGEHQQTVLVTVATPARISMDLRKP